MIRNSRKQLCLASATVALVAGQPLRADTTIDSSAKVTTREDAIIQADDADGRSGILVEAGSNFSIGNAGEIYVTEDGDANAIADGSLAEASGRYGIRVLSNSGNIDNSGAISVEGLGSNGIALENDFSGNIVNTGTIGLVGDYGVGVQTQFSIFQERSP